MEKHIEKIDGGEMTYYPIGHKFKMNTSTKIKSLALQLAGGALYAGLGFLAGQAIEHLPYVNTLISNLSNIPAESLDSLTAISLGTYGFLSSGIGVYDDYPNRFKVWSLGSFVRSITPMKVSEDTKDYHYLTRKIR